MRPRPKACSDFGTYGCSVPMPISGRVRDVDYCIADLVAALNAGGIPTKASCCGHDQMPGNILLEDGRVLVIQRVKP